MFQLVKNSLHLTKKQITLLKSHLNSETLQKAIDMQPTVLMLYCHGDENKANPSSKGNKITLWAEDDKKPSLVQYLGD